MSRGAREARKYLLQIHEHMETENQPRWGLPIVRCTYTSQQRWDDFIAQFTSDIHEYYLQHELDARLSDSLHLPLIENRDLLENASIEEARKTFDEWITEDMALHFLGPCPWREMRVKTDDTRERLYNELDRSPYWNFFIYVDEAVLSSVVDSTTRKEWRTISEGDDYYIILVPSTLRLERSQVRDLNGKPYEDDKMDDFKKTRAAKFALDYSTIVHPDMGFDQITYQESSGLCITV